jgi:hypothetical protein
MTGSTFVALATYMLWKLQLWAGPTGIVVMLLDLGSPLAKSLYDDAIIRTIKANRTAMVDLLLNRRQHHSDLNMERAFCVTLIRTTAELNNRESSCIILYQKICRPLERHQLD